MKKFNKVLSLLLALVMIISCSPIGVAAESGFAMNRRTSPEISTNGPLSLAVGNTASDMDVSAPDAGFVFQQNTSVLDPIPDSGLTKFESTGIEPFSKSDAAVLYDADDEVTFIVVTEARPQLEVFSVGEIAAQTSSVLKHAATQNGVINSVKSEVASVLGEKAEIGFTYTVATTGFSVSTTYGNKAILEKMPGVKTVYVAPTFSIPETNTTIDLSPLTNNASTMIGADVLNGTGYTGKGMRIAILDTGLNIDHPSFQALSEDVLVDPMTLESVEAIWETLNAAQLTSRLNTSYKSTKIPYAFNYSAGTFDVSNTYAGSDHGTHVAGIAAANKLDSTSVIGVAPDAQLVIMQVFNAGGGASWDIVMAALEDCVRLEVDAANLSLGAAAGFTDNESAMLETMNLFLESDIQVLIASGNDTNNALMNSWGLNMSLITNPDIGLAGTPSTYSAALAVASANNDGSESVYFTVSGKDIAFSDTATNAATSFLRNFISQTLEYVVIPGVGEEADYEGIDVTGKVALVSRGVTSFPEKQKVAQEHGAIACVVYNNTLGNFYMQINDTAEDIPCVSISKSAGLYMIEAAGTAGTGSLTVCDADVKIIKTDRTMSSFSSWGVTPDLKLKPEITGVGGSIYSAVDPQISGSYYGIMSGTSMATPQITGAMAVLIQYLDEKYPEITGAEQRTLAANLLMSTADPVMFSETLPYSPRYQGAGLANLISATTSPAYLSNPKASETRPKAELGDDPTRTGVYEFSFEITNLSSETLIYEFDSTIMTEAVYSGYFIENAPYALGADLTIRSQMPGESVLKYDFNDDGAITTADARALLLHIAGIRTVSEDSLHYEYLDVNGDGSVNQADARVITDYCAELDVRVDLTATIGLEVNQISVPANGTVTLHATLTLSEQDKAYLEQFPNGIYVEGFLYAKNIVDDTEGVADPTLVMPIVGFYGDWSDAPMFDDPEAYSLYPTYIFTDYSMLGQNPYFRNGKSGEQYNAISYSNTLAEIDFGLLRNAKRMTFTVTDTVTGEEYFALEGSYMTKTYYSTSYGQILPTWLSSSYGELWDGKDQNGNKLPDGTTVEYTIEGWLDDGDNLVDDAWSFFVTLDTTYPEILNHTSLQESMSVDGERTYLTLDILENHYVAALIFMSPEGIIMGKYEVDNTPGEMFTETYDITGFGGEFTIVLADYACNETEIDVVLNLGEQNNAKPQPVGLDSNRLYGCETYGEALVDAGWFSVAKNNFYDLRNETYDSNNRYYSAEYVNGYLIAQNANTGDLVLITPSNTYWGQRTLVKANGKIGEPNVWVLYDMALDHSASEAYDGATDKLYAVGWMYKGDNNNDGHDDGYNALFEISFNSNGVNVSETGRIVGVDGDLLTLGITTDGRMYGIDTSAILYELNPERVWDDSIGDWGDWAIETTLIGGTDFRDYPGYGGANVIQSMGYDHNTGTMYWYANSQVLNGYNYTNINMTYAINLEDASCTEIGTYGESGQTCLFVPNKLESNLFVEDVIPNGFEVEPYQMTMVETQIKRVNVSWTPWNAQAQNVTWSSDDESVAVVDEYGFVTAVSEGETYINATAQIWVGEWIVTDAGEWVWVEGMKDVTRSVALTVVKSEDALYGYVVSDFRNRENDFTWITYSDKTPTALTQVGAQEITSYNPMTGEAFQTAALWQGGTYYNGYVYTVVKDYRDDGTGAYASASILYRSKVTKGNTPEEIVIGEPEEIGYSLICEIGNISFDYNTGRMYGVDLTYGGLVIIDLDTGAVDQLGTFSGDCGGPIIATAMCVTADGTIVIADMYSNLYIVDAETLNTTAIYTNGADSWFYGAMTYDYNTGSIYWAPCMDANQSPLNMVIITNEWGYVNASVINMGAVSSKAGVEQTVMFTIPENEPETQIIPIEDIKIANGDLSGLVGGTKQLNAVTTPARPTVNAKTWTSDNESIATVDQFGKLTLVSVGTTTITVTTTDKDGSTYTDSIEITVLPAAGEMVAFLAYDDGGTNYYDFWMTINDFNPENAVVGQSMISIYSLRSGTYYDGYYYGYTDTGAFLRINAADPADYKILGTLNRDTGCEQVTAMAMDYTSGTMYGLTLSHPWSYYDKNWNYLDPCYGELVTIDLDTGAVTTVATLDQHVYTLACTGDGTLYAAGVRNDDPYSDAGLYTLDKTTAEATLVTELAGAYVFTGAHYAGYSKYNPQMAYDFATNRLYLNASANDQYWNAYSGLYMIQLGDEITVTDLGDVGLELRGVAKESGNLYLGMLTFIPDASDLPAGTVNGVILNKTAGRVAVGGNAQLVANVRPSNVQDSSVSWVSSDTSIAVVDQTGLVTGISEGTVEITVSSNENPAISSTCVITVVELSGEQSVAYTVSAQKDALISFNPALPAQTAQVIANFSGGGTVGGMVYGEDCLYYVLEIGYTNYLYHYDFLTQQHTELAQLEAWAGVDGMAYDAVNNYLYVVGGFYLFQYDMSKLLDSSMMTSYSNYMMDSDYCNLSGVAVDENGYVYTIGTDLYNGQAILRRYDPVYLNNSTVMNGAVAVNVVPGATELAYDASCGLFYITDAGNIIYAMDKDGNVEMVDILGEGIDLNGFAVNPG